MKAFAARLDQLNEVVGRTVCWLAVLMVVVQFLVVVLRYVFGIGFVALQESILYMHGILFMAAAGYTLLHDEHVRVDIFYRDASPRKKAFVNLFGTLFLLWPICALIWWTSFDYVAMSWSVFEGSRELSGLPLMYLLKTFILIFASLLSVQGLSLAIRSGLEIWGQRDV